MAIGVSIKGSAFAKPEFICCKTKEEMVAAYNHFIEEGNSGFSTNIEDFEIGRGKIVALQSTLMKWGRIFLTPNTEFRRNKLRAKGYKEINL